MPSDDPLLHLSRAAGLGAFLVLWLDMCLGVALTSSLKIPFVSRWRVGDLHQFTSLLGLGLLATHIAVLVGLQQQAFNVAELFVPLARRVNPLAPLLGIGGLYLLLLISGVSHARRFVGKHVWRMVHLLSFGAFGLCLEHAIVAGPDTSVGWLRLVYGLSVLVLVLLMIVRIRHALAPQRAMHSGVNKLSTLGR